MHKVESTGRNGRLKCFVNLQREKGVIIGDEFSIDRLPLVLTIINIAHLSLVISHELSSTRTVAVCSSLQTRFLLQTSIDTSAKTCLMFLPDFPFARKSWHEMEMEENEDPSKDEETVIGVTDGAPLPSSSFRRFEERHRGESGKL